MIKTHSMKKCIAIFWFVVSIGCVTVQGQEKYTQETEELIDLVIHNLVTDKQDTTYTYATLDERMAHYKVPAVSIAVIDNYEISWARAYGWADKEQKISATTSTLFQAASISKSINAVGVLKWVESNNIDLEADVNNFLSNWKLESRRKAKGKEISLANILSHTAGLSGHGFRGYEIDDKIPTTIQILNGKKPANSRRIKSLFEPDLKFKYSGGGTTITQQILIENTGIAYDDYMKKEVLNPLGMQESFYSNKVSQSELVATGYWSSGNPLKGKYHIYPEMAAAGLWTNPTELSYYIIEIQKSFIGESNKLLSQQMVEKMLSPYLKDGITGLGVFFQQIGDNMFFNHGGSNEGFKCSYQGSIEGGKGVVIMVNSENYDIIPEIMRSVAKIYGW